jgi:preprotein translocase subunit SecG
MYIVVSVLILLASVLMILVVLVQNSKGGGLAANFQGSGQVMGVRKTADFLEKATWGLAIALVFLSLMILFFYEGGSQVEQRTSIIERSGVTNIPSAVDPNDAAPAE